MSQRAAGSELGHAVINLACPLFPQSLQHLHKGGCNFVRLFAREIRPGWDTCGVEVSKFAAEGVVAALG